ncbi:MAG: nicotinamide mononucleotide transporter [Clostridia bacterium]|nr:nicotinamide mononucleotide transporter [Clostridia bacterium]
MQKNKFLKNLDLTKILAVITFIFVAAGAFHFKLKIFDFLPLLISTFVMLLQSKVNRYAFIVGALNSILYAVADFYMTLYSQAAFALLFSLPVQIITFICWNKNTRNGVTETKSLTNKGRIILFASMAVGWGILYLIFSFFKSEYLVLDNTVTVIGIVSTLLVTFRYSEYSLFQIISGTVNIILFATMLVNDPSRIVWLVFMIYSMICSTTAFIRMNKTKQNK